MKLIDSYLDNFFGLRITRPRKHSQNLEQCCNSTYSAIFNFDEIIVHGINVIVAEYIVKDKIVITRLVTTYNEMKSYFDFPLLLLLPNADSTVRRHLLYRRINFIVPGQQIYFPELYIYLKDTESIKREKKKQLSIPAQVLLLYHLQKRSLADTPFSEIAKLIGYSNKSISLVAKELQNFGIAKVNQYNQYNQYKSFSFYRSCIDLWEQIKPYLHNPIAAFGYTDKNIDALNPVKCGSVESYIWHIDQVVEYGITQNEARQNKIKLYATVRSKRVCLWRYNPRILASADGYADILSIILSYSVYPRDRVQSKLLELVKWADDPKTPITE